MLERVDDMVMTGQRAPFFVSYAMAVEPSGRIRAFQADFAANSGYSKNLTEAVVSNATSNADATYNMGRIYAGGRVCYTNNQTNTAMRAFGRPQAMLAAEMALEQCATKLGMLPEKVRELNLYKDGDQTHYGQVLEHCNARKCWDACVQLSGFWQRLGRVQQFNRTSREKKRGIALLPLKYGSLYEPPAEFLNQAGVLVLIYLDGTVQLNVAAVEMGQGIHTKLAQIAARELGIHLDSVRVMPTSTDKIPNTSPTSASLSMDLSGPAVKAACEELRGRLEPLREAEPQLGWKDLVNRAYQRKVQLSATGFASIPHEGFDPVARQGKMYPYFVFGAVCCEVELDVLTGDHRLLRVDIVMDIGNSVNPAIDIGQIEGAFVQGYGWLTMEELKVRPDGRWLSRGPGAYKIPTADDVPRLFNVRLLDDESSPAVYSSKLLGEPPLLGAVAAVMALKEAVKAARVDNGADPVFRLDTPATPARLRMACADPIANMVPELPPDGSFEPWTVTL